MSNELEQIQHQNLGSAFCFLSFLVNFDDIIVDPACNCMFEVNHKNTYATYFRNK